MAKKKTTVYLDEDLLRSARVMAARTGRKDYEVFEDALRSYLGTDVLERVWARSDLSAGQAAALAAEEIAKYRSGER